MSYPICSECGGAIIDGVCFCGESEWDEPETPETRLAHDEENREIVETFDDDPDPDDLDWGDDDFDPGWNDGQRFEEDEWGYPR